MDHDKRVCPVCETYNLVKFISFGKMPVANAFLKKEQLEDPNFQEFMYDMEVGFCENCKMTQMINIVPYDKYIVLDQTGKTHYAFFSSTSKAMQEHFAELAKEVENRFLSDNFNARVLEIGSNDGIMLKTFKNKQNVLGIEPSQNVAEVAQQQGIETITEFFSEPLARKISAERGKFKAILTTNVFLNIIDIHDFMRGVKELLTDDGVFITEDPYIIDILEKTSYDQIYDEHVWYFSLTALSNLFEQHGMEIFDAEHQWVHGGSMRVYACKKGLKAHEKTERLKKYLEIEKEKKIDSLQTYLDFAQRVEQSRKELQELLRSLKSQGKKIVGYAAASKGTIVNNYCNIGKDILEYISDSTPYKQGLFSPGKHIPIVSPEYFHNDKEVDYALLAAWNHADEIMKKETEFLNRGGRFIVHYPKARILEPEEKIKTTEFEGVEIKKLKIFADDQGYLFETLRNDDEMFDGQFGQVLVSVLYPGIIKGLHRHEKQIDYTTCIKGNIKYVIAKEKPGSKNSNNAEAEADIKTYIIGERNPVLLKIPPGYWHGYMPLANEQAIVLHLMNKSYNPKEPDTDEIDPFTFGDPWTIKDG